MRILFVTGRFPRPGLRGDQARAFHQIRLLSRRHAVTLVAGVDSGVSAADRRAIADLGAETIEVRRPALSVADGLLRGLIAGRPVQTALYDTREFRRVVHRLLNEGRHDVAHVQLARLAAPFERGVSIPRVIDFVDALSVNMQRRGQRTRGPMAWAVRAECRRLQGYERSLCGSFEAATVVSEADRRAIGPFSNLSVNANGVDLSRFPFHEGDRDLSRIVLTGNLGYLPNVDAATWLARDILPRIRAVSPEVTLELVGARPAPVILDLASESSGIRVIPFVPDMSPHLSGASVAVAPMRAGSGQLLKILEAMASGTPVVATRLGASGLEVEEGRHLLFAETAEEFAAQVTRLLGDRELRARLSREARTLVEERYTWERSVAELEDIYASVVVRGGAPWGSTSASTRAIKASASSR